MGRKLTPRIILTTGKEFNKPTLEIITKRALQINHAKGFEAKFFFLMLE